MKTLTVFALASALFLASCGTGSSTENATTDSTSVATDSVKVTTDTTATTSAADTTKK